MAAYLTLQVKAGDSKLRYQHHISAAAASLSVTVSHGRPPQTWAFRGLVSRPWARQPLSLPPCTACCSSR
ncbi:hypothetical protein CgunFtcFv8_009613 [Champsocephalus gunnari]|uniref:Uncharacterized protein n=1 Tax=Champsocephalus gunnari TaxID=52237 RepID=A0AAN8C393_CHAGU|nr:hypothetical protein CgunFtcFv8_009613 [Champsocephalus gunnari]